MKKLNINVPVSEEVLFILKKDEQSFQKEILKILAIEFFKEKKLSLGKAAELACMDKNDFLELLGFHNIDVFHYTEKELEKEIDQIEKLVTEVSK